MLLPLPDSTTSYTTQAGFPTKDFFNWLKSVVSTFGDLATSIGAIPSNTIRTGTIRSTIQTAPESGWVMLNDATIGDGSSGATNRANADCVDLFTLIFNNLSDANAPIQTSAGGATTRAAQGTAAAAWAAHCRITLPKALGRAVGVAGAGSGLTSRALGDTTGTETHTLTAAQIPSGLGTFLTSGTTASINTATTDGGIGNGATYGGINVTINPATASAGGSGGSHPNMQPTSFWNAEIKL